MDFHLLIPAEYRREPPDGAAIDAPRLAWDGIAADAFVPPKAKTGRRLAAVAVATMLHCGILYAGLPSPDERVGGGGGSDEASIEVSMISAGAAGAPGFRVEAGVVATEPPLDMEREAAAQTIAKPPPVPVPRLEPETLTVSEAEAPTAPKQPQDIAVEPKPPVEQASQAPESLPQAPAAKIAMALPSLSPTAADARAEASAGEIQAYARAIIELLSRSRPRARAGMARGTVHVVFEVTGSGVPANVHVTRSSGSRLLDDLAVEAIRGTTFPTPPTAATVAQRTYELPYHFR